mgnify:CR=1 FL=1|tara:strand:+ start:523 stop:1239 length:717 start_codon:yes stop_codon:yes gene_type:complete
MAEEKKKKKKKSLMDSLPGLKMLIEGARSRGIFRTNEENRRIKEGQASRDRQSGESRMRKGKLYEDAPKGGGKIAKSMAESQKLKDFSPKGSGGQAKKILTKKKAEAEAKRQTGSMTAASKRQKLKDAKARASEFSSAKSDRIKREKEEAGTKGLTTSQRTGVGVKKSSSKPKKDSSEPKTFKEAFKNARAKGLAKFEYPKGSGKMFAAVTMDEVKKAHKQGKIKRPTLAAFLRMKKK